MNDTLTRNKFQLITLMIAILVSPGCGKLNSSDPNAGLAEREVVRNLAVTLGNVQNSGDIDAEAIAAQEQEEFSLIMGD